MNNFFFFAGGEIWKLCKFVTRKKEKVEPVGRQPYLILVCLAKSSADVIGESIRSAVKKAAKLAVYDEIMINVKNHQKPAHIRVDVALLVYKKNMQIIFY